MVNDGDELFDYSISAFEQLTNRSRGALYTRAAFLGTNQPYLLYFWQMLDKYQLLSTSFSELSSKISSKNGGKGVPSAINSYGEDVDSNVDEIDFSDVTSSSIEASSRKSTRNKDSSSSTKLQYPAVWMRRHRRAVTHTTDQSCTLMQPTCTKKRHRGDQLAYN